MSAPSSLPTVLCTLCAGVSILTLLIPQKRTYRIVSFVLGLVIIATILTAFVSAADSIDISFDVSEDTEYPDYDEEYISAVARETAENLVKVSDELLRSEGITADDIRLSVKISDDCRIYIDRVDIYINESYEERTSDVESIIYRNLAKEPDVYVNREENQQADRQ